MVFNCIDWAKDTDTPKIHPTQKPVEVLKTLIELFTDPGEVVIDPVAGSGTSLVAAIETGRKVYGFEIKKPYYKDALKLINDTLRRKDEIEKYGYAKTEINNAYPVLFD